MFVPRCLDALQSRLENVRKAEHKTLFRSVAPPEDRAVPLSDRR